MSLPNLPRPSVPALPRVPGGLRPMGPFSFGEYPARATIRDEYGLPPSYERYGPEQRRLIRLAFRESGYPVGESPPLRATIPEWVFFGLLLDWRFDWRQGIVTGHRNFTFQSYELGGRQPGGAVVDFMVYYNGTAIAVRVHSIYHEAVSPFGDGGQKLLTDLRSRTQLMASSFIDRVVDVNTGPERALEFGSRIQVQAEMHKVLGWMVE